MAKVKNDRLQIIQKIVSSYKIGSQEELLSILKSKGFGITQATLCRDMKSLKIVKSPDAQGNYVYTLPAINYMNQTPPNNSPEQDVLGFVSIEFSGSLGVIKTRPGYAQGIASDIDNRAGHAILATIAGDDTILLIPREGISRQLVIDALSRFIPDIQS